MRDSSFGGGGAGRAGFRVFLFFLCLYLLGGHGYVENPDAEVEFQTAKALLLRGDPALVPQAGPYVRRILQAQGGTAFGAARGKDGRYYSWFGIGHVLWEIPFLAAGLGLEALFPSVEKAFREQPSHLVEFAPGLKGADLFPRLLVSLSHPLAAALACWVLLSLGLLLGLDLGTSLFMVLVYGLCTMAWPFSRESLSDGPAALMALLALRDSVAWARKEGGAWVLARAGLWAGLMVATRIMLFLCLLPLFFYLAWAIRTRRERFLPRAGAFLAPLVLVGLGVMLYNQARFGNPLESGYGEQARGAFWKYPFLAGFLGLLLSPGKGFFLFNPPALTLCGLPWNPSRPPRGESFLFLGLFLVLLLPTSFAAGWHGSWCWGPRYLLPALGPLVLLGGFLYKDLSRRKGPFRLFFRAALLAGFLVSLGGVLSPIQGWYAASFAAARQVEYRKEVEKNPALANQVYNMVFLEPRYSPLLGQWRYFLSNLEGGLRPGGTPGLAREWFGLDSDLALPPRSPQLMGFRHIWYVDLFHRFGAWWIFLFPAGLCLGLLACLRGLSGPMRSRGRGGTWSPDGA